MAPPKQGGTKDGLRWQIVTPGSCADYRCGVMAGDRVRLKRDLVVRDHRGKPTGTTHRAGPAWTVLRGVAEEPETVWLAQPDGASHTWDSRTFWEHFERVP